MSMRIAEIDGMNIDVNRESAVIFAAKAAE